MIEVTVKLKRKGDLKKMLSRVRRALVGPKRVKVGILDGAVADRAMYNEFGTVHIPERPFVRNAMRDNQGKYKTFTATAARRIARGEADMTTELNRLGLVAVSDIQDSIGSNIAPANAPSTVKQKGSSKTLIDTGEMRQKVSHELD